jgi:hypothetical protein
MAECNCQWSYDRSAVMLCPTCRADLELGRMVRAMPKGAKLKHEPNGTWYFFLGMGQWHIADNVMAAMKGPPG